MSGSVNTRTQLVSPAKSNRTPPSRCTRDRLIATMNTNGSSDSGASSRMPGANNRPSNLSQRRRGGAVSAGAGRAGAVVVMTRPPIPGRRSG
jgi:hypothetical protein